MHTAITQELERRGITVHAASDFEDEMGHGRGAKKIKFTQELLNKAIELDKPDDLAAYLHGKYIVSEHKISTIGGAKAAAIVIEVLADVDPKWEDKQCIAFHKDQVVVVEKPAHEVAQFLQHNIDAHLAKEKAKKAPKEAAEPKAVRVTKPRAPKAPVDPDAPAKPKRVVTRKPKAGE